MDKKPKDIQIVKGNGKDLNISPVYDHISTDKPKSTTKGNKNIVVPKTKKQEK